MLAIAVALTVAALMQSAARDARASGAAPGLESQLFAQIENISRPFARHLDRIVFREGFMRIESRQALEHMVGWLNGNSYPRLAEFLGLLDLEDAATLFNAFKSGRPVGSDPLIPVVENLESVGQRTALSLPFRGVFFIVQGNGGTVSHHKGGNNEFAWDMVIMRDGAMFKGNAHKNKNYFAWGEPVLAPAPGRILNSENNNPDHSPLTTKMGDANFALIDHENGEISVIYHFMQNSVTVRPGDRVERGERIAAVGDSGISMFPHIHYQLDRGDPTGDKLFAAPARFACYFARTADSDWRLVISGIPAPAEFVINADDFVRFPEMRKK